MIIISPFREREAKIMRTSAFESLEFKMILKTIFATSFHQGFEIASLNESIAPGSWSKPPPSAKLTLSVPYSTIEP